MRRRGAPLLRTAVVGGGAYMMGSAAAQKSAVQAQHEAAQNAQIAELQRQATQQSMTPTPPPGQAYYPAQEQPMMAPAEPSRQPPPAADPLAMLKQLGELKAAGVLTEEEFEVKKAQLLKQI